MANDPQFDPNEPVVPLGSSEPQFDPNEPVLPLKATAGAQPSTEPADHGWLSETKKAAGRAYDTLTAPLEMPHGGAFQEPELLKRGLAGVQLAASPLTGAIRSFGGRGLQAADEGMRGVAESMYGKDAVDQKSPRKPFEHFADEAERGAVLAPGIGFGSRIAPAAAVASTAKRINPIASAADRVSQALGDTHPDFIRVSQEAEAARREAGAANAAWQDAIERDPANREAGPEFEANAAAEDRWQAAERAANEWKPPRENLRSVAESNRAARAAAVTSATGKANPIVSAADRISQASGTPVEVPRAFASDNMAVQRAGQIARNAPFIGDSIPKATGRMADQLEVAKNNIASNYGEGSGPNVASRIGQTLHDESASEAGAASEAATRSDDAVLAAWQKYQDDANAAINNKETQALNAARTATGQMNPQDMGQILIDRLRAGEREAGDKKSALYDKADTVSASITKNSVRSVYDRITKTLSDQGWQIDPRTNPAAMQLTPATNAMLTELRNFSDLIMPNRLDGKVVWPEYNKMTSEQKKFLEGVYEDETGLPAETPHDVPEWYQEQAEAKAAGKKTPLDQYLESPSIHIKDVTQAMKRLRQMALGAKSTDKAAASIIMHNFYDWQTEAFNKALYSGSPHALKAIREANAANKSWRTNYYDDKNDADKIINKVITEEITPQQMANWIIGSGEVGAQGASSRLLTKIGKITNNDPETFNIIRSGVAHRLFGAEEGVTPKNAEAVANQIYKFFNGTGRAVANKLYTPDQKKAALSYANIIRQSQEGRDLVSKVAANTKPSQMPIGPGPMQKLAESVLGKKGKPDEALFTAINSYAKSKSRADIKTLAKILETIPEQQRGDLAGAIIRNLGKTSQTDGFSLDNFATAWSDYTPQAKDLLFGNSGLHRRALDDIAAISQRYKEIGRRFGNPSGTGQIALGGVEFSALSYLWHNPMAALYMVPSAVGAYTFAKLLSKPATAAKTANLFKRILDTAKNTNPIQIAGLSAALKSFVASANKLGSDITVPQLLQGAQGPGTSNADEKRAKGGAIKHLIPPAPIPDIDLSSTDKLADDMIAKATQFAGAQKFGSGGTVRGYAYGGGPTDPSADDLAAAASRHLGAGQELDDPDTFDKRTYASSTPTMDPARFEPAGRNQGELTGTDLLSSYKDRQEGVDRGFIPTVKNAAKSVYGALDDFDRYTGRMADNAGEFGIHALRLAKNMATMSPDEVKETPEYKALNHGMNALTGAYGENREQLWPEEWSRSGATLAHDLMTGKLSHNSYDPATGEIVPNPEVTQRVQDMAGMAGGASLVTGAREAARGAGRDFRILGKRIGKAPEEAPVEQEGSNPMYLGATPFLRPATTMLSDSGKSGAPLSALERAAVEKRLTDQQGGFTNLGVPEGRDPNTGAYIGQVPKFKGRDEAGRFQKAVDPYRNLPDINTETFGAADTTKKPQLRQNGRFVTQADYFRNRVPTPEELTKIQQNEFYNQQNAPSMEDINKLAERQQRDQPAADPAAVEAWKAKMPFTTYSDTGEAAPLTALERSLRQTRGDNASLSQQAVDELTDKLRARYPDINSNAADAWKDRMPLLSDSGRSGAPLSALERGFYSQVEKTIQAAPQSKMHGVQWANWLKNQPGVKPEELQHTGLDQWLRSQNKPVTKQEVVDFTKTPKGAQNAKEVPAAANNQASGNVRGGVENPSGGSEGLRAAQLQAERRAAGRPTLPGLPTQEQIVNGELYVPGPYGKAHDVAEQYIKDRAPPSYHRPPEKYHPLDKEHSKAIARAYEEMKHDPNDPAVKASYEALIRETMAQYQAIKESGLKITPVNAKDYPYEGNPRAVVKDVADNNHMAFFKTNEGFGTGDAIHPDNPMLQSSGEKIGDHDMLNNDIFRVAHDYFGHVKNGYGFRAAGEDNAWRAHASMYSDLARPAMTTELRGQNSWANYGPHGDHNRTASGADTIYAPQKVGLMPEWTMRDRGSPEPTMVYHGTPYAFDQFDMSKLGSGEGNQAYGHGLYFAGHSPVSEWYRYQLAARRDPLLKKYGLDAEQGAHTGLQLAAADGDVHKLVTELHKQIEDLKAENRTDKATKNMIADREAKIGYLTDPERAKGHLYEAAIDHPVENFLDWDKPLSEQPKPVQELFHKEFNIPASARRPMGELYNNAARVRGPDWLNDALKEVGTHGIRYKDQGSRGTDSAGKGTSNYVTFDAPRITRRLLSDTSAAAPVSALEQGLTPRPGSKYYEGEPTINAGVNAKPNKKVQTVADPHRMMFPGIYRNPREIAEEAASNVGKEDPAMKQLFGVDRGDLREMAKDRVGNEEPNLRLKANPKGSLAAQNIQTPKNTQRLVDILSEAGKHEDLRTADAWYIQDPVYQRLEEMFGPEEAKKRYSHLNTMTGMASPGSNVVDEIQRGTAAHWLEQQGRFKDFLKYAGMPNENRNAKNYPRDMRPIPGHPYHRTTHAEPMQKYVDTGQIQSNEPKVPLYVHASGVPETGFQTKGPVGDAHFSRGVGLSDTRRGPSDVQGSFSTSEYQTLQPWWQHDVAGKVGLESVPAQARLWTALGPQTGVKSDLGAPKLELLAKQIMKAARRHNISPERARDLILSGKMGAFKDGGAVDAEDDADDVSGPIQHQKAENVVARAGGGRVLADNIDKSPSEAQKKANNYKHDHLSLFGLDFTIENAKGMKRSGVGRDGDVWEVTMPAHYGYIKRSEGADGDHVDVYLGPHPKSRQVFIVNQVDADTKKFDEHKCMLCFGSLQQALNTYKKGFSDGRGEDRIGSVVQTTIDKFKSWLEHGNTKRPFV